eukprot:CAMPEP_0171143512 /NCGR_PEP_ID=MMETSP0766_2-20121228/144405_1 /TAXON_ID=439317 /ORGANISM="Gambierdiscus australes, Strain CAWD 149" /LENGTH=176 /DNA_ID=CAMNT_0011607337 /DNA_START=85 /DNA_END=616 /DNA_ORIENTATION=+
MYQKCRHGLMFKYVYPPQLWLFNHTCERGELCYLQTKLIDVAYTIAREGGPECMRLYTAGYLWQFVPSCSALVPLWQDAAREDYLNRSAWQSRLQARPAQGSPTLSSLSSRLKSAADSHVRCRLLPASLLTSLRHVRSICMRLLGGASKTSQRLGVREKRGPTARPAKRQNGGSIA